MNNPVILCVDDDPSVLRALRSLLGNIGMKHKVLICESGDEALDVIANIQKNGIELAVALVDCIMPGMRGDELLIRIHDISPDTVTIMLTGQSDFDCVKRVINKANLFRYLEKPFDNNDLLLTVKNCALLYNQRRDLLLENSSLKNELADLKARLDQLSN